MSFCQKKSRESRRTRVMMDFKSPSKARGPYDVMFDTGVHTLLFVRFFMLPSQSYRIQMMHCSLFHVVPPFVFFIIVVAVEDRESSMLMATCWTCRTGHITTGC
eukprot:scaffold337_cov172-Amphora_coffeaeformis.AAC.1